MVIKTRPKAVIKAVNSEPGLGGNALDMLLFDALAAEVTPLHILCSRVFRSMILFQIHARGQSRHHLSQELAA